MSDVGSSTPNLQTIFDQRILPVVFPHEPSTVEPGFLLATGPAGVNLGRAVGQLRGGREIAVVSAIELRAFHPRYRELSRSRSTEASRTLAEAASGWMRSALQHARTTQRSLLLDGALSTPDVALATTGLFARSGFSTTVVVVAGPRSETLLATASEYLSNTRAGRTSHFVSVAEHDKSYENVRALVESLEATPSVDRLTIIGRDGGTRFDAASADPAGFAGARNALDQERKAPLRAPEAMRWLSELRAITDYTLRFQRIARPLADVLIELHDIGVREILPSLPLPQESLARPTAEVALAARRQALSEAAQAQQRPERQPAPTISVPEPDRGISI